MNEEIKEILAYILSLTYGNESAIKGADKILNYITSLQEENQKLNKVIDEFEKFCNEEIKEWYKADFGEEIIDNRFKQTLTTYEFILKKLTELKKEVE